MEELNYEEIFIKGVKASDLDEEGKFLVRKIVQLEQESQPLADELNRKRAAHAELTKDLEAKVDAIKSANDEQSKED